MSAQGVFQLIDLFLQECEIGHARGCAQIQPVSARHRDRAGVKPQQLAPIGGSGVVLQLRDHTHPVGIGLGVARHGQEKTDAQG